MKSIFFLIWFLLFFSFASAQIDSIYNPPTPIGGIDRLALEYYKIDFSQDQRKKLENVELEFIYLINVEGIAALEEVNGIDDHAILDSLYSRTVFLPKFQPESYNGIPQEGLYFMKMSFPVYNRNLHTYSNSWRKIKLDDFETIEYSNERLDILIGLVGNSFVGNPQKYLGIGGGMKIDINFTGKKNFGGGLIMAFYGNSLKQEFPINDSKDQNDGPPTLLIGLSFHKVLITKNTFIPQIELNYAIQNITPNNGDNDFTQFKGFSPGVVINYSLNIGKKKVYTYYGNPSITTHGLNFHLALRAMLMDQKEANGGMIEFGMSYRLSSLFLSNYSLREY